MLTPKTSRHPREELGCSGVSHRAGWGAGQAPPFTGPRTLAAWARAGRCEWKDAKSPDCPTQQGHPRALGTNRLLCPVAPPSPLADTEAPWLRPSPFSMCPLQVMQWPLLFCPNFCKGAPSSEQGCTICISREGSRDSDHEQKPNKPPLFLPELQRATTRGPRGSLVSKGNPEDLQATHPGLGPTLPSEVPS